MIEKYQTEDCDIIIEYLLDTILWIEENGKAEIPKCMNNRTKQQSVYLYLNEGICLIENAYTEQIFSIILQSLFYEKYVTCNDSSERDLLVLIMNLIRFIYADDFLAFMKTSNLWSNNVKEYGYINILPKLDEEKKIQFLDFI